MKEEIDIVEEVLDGEVCAPSGDFRWEYIMHPRDHYDVAQPTRVLTIKVDDSWFNRVSRADLEEFWKLLRGMQRLGGV